MHTGRGLVRWGKGAACAWPAAAPCTGTWRSQPRRRGSRDCTSSCGWRTGRAAPSGRRSRPQPPHRGPGSGASWCKLVQWGNQGGGIGWQEGRGARFWVGWRRSRQLQLPGPQTGTVCDAARTPAAPPGGTREGARASGRPWAATFPAWQRLPPPPPLMQGLSRTPLAPGDWPRPHPCLSVLRDAETSERHAQAMPGCWDADGRHSPGVQGKLAVRPR